MHASNMVARCLSFLFFLTTPLLLLAQSETVAIDYLKSERKNLGLSEADVRNPVIHSKVYTEHNGLSHYYLKQRTEGIVIFNTMININVSREAQVISQGGNFVKDASQKSNASNPLLSAEQAVLAAAEHLQLGRAEVPAAIKENDKKFLVKNCSYSLRDIPIQLVYHHNDQDQLLLAWDLSLDLPRNGDHLSLRIDALTGKVLEENNWTVHCQFHDHSHCGNNNLLLASAAVQPALPAPPPPPAAYDYNVFALPVESPNHGSRALVNAPWTQAANASPFGWHDTNGAAGQEYNITRGNNAHAYQDRNASDGSSGDEPDGGINLDFNFAYNPNAEPIVNTDAAVTNLFYVTNKVHDILYQYGFDESGGNFQSNNYGKGGQGSDHVYAECQDGSGTNNANFSTPPDGGNPRMQMFNWSASSNSADLFTVNSPASVAGTYSISQATFGPGITSTAITGDVVEAFDNSADPALVCNTPTTNVSGKIAMVERGECTFVTKVQNVQDQGAIACIVCNNVAGGTVTMSGSSSTITIPVVMLSAGDCANLKAAGNLNVTLVDNGNSGPSQWDSSFDNGIVIHELVHGLSTRLTGGPGSSSCLFNEEQMGEGISDWYGLMLTMNAGDTGAAPRGIGTWVANQATTGQGIRPAPYSTDMNFHNNYTYGNLCDSEISVPHGVGFVWATMLYDLSWALIDKYGFDADLIGGAGGNNIALQLVTDGLKIQPCSPGFVDARDAILLADQINNNGDNECLIWDVFARRGLGFSAAQGSTNDRCDGTQAFDMPPDCDKLSIKKTAIPSVSAGSIITYNFEIKNRKSSSVSNVQITDALPPNTTYINGSANCNGSFAGGTVTFNPGTLGSGATVNCSCQVSTNPGYFSTFFFEDDMESGAANFTTGTAGTISLNWSIETTNPYSGANSWFADNIEGITDQYLIFDVPASSLSGNPELHFWHYYDTETSWDGGVVEISTNNGSSWNDLGSSITQNGYNQTIEVNPASAISGRQAFTGNSLGYIQSKVNLSAYIGQAVKIRFRFASDEYVGGTGWWIDDVSIIDVREIVNEACVSSAQGDSECDQAGTLMLAPSLSRVKVELLLEGPYSGSGQMFFDLDNLSLIPLAQPFASSTLNYTGTETFTSIPANAVDWVLIELRAESNPSTVMAKAAGMLTSDGKVYGEDGLEGLPFNGLSAGSYYIVVRHKSHLAVMSKSSISIPNATAYDFTAPGAAYGGGPLLDMGGGNFALHGGDLNQDGAMTFQDFNIYLSDPSAIYNYLPQDINLDGLVTVADYNIYKKNASKIGISQVQ